MDTLAALAFAGLIIAQFAAVIAVSTLNREDTGSEPNKSARPQPSQPGFAARFCKHLDEETTKLYRDVSFRAGGRPPRGFVNPFFVALVRALRPVRTGHTGVTLVPLATTERTRVKPEERFASAKKLREAA